jgi:Nucleotidyltransferase domain.
MGFLTNPLDGALSSTSKIRLLRLLIEQDRTVSGREAARLTGMSRTAMLVAINDLTRLGLVYREESGRQFLCRANRDHKLLQKALVPLFATESEWSALFFAAVRDLLATWEERPAKSSGHKNAGILAVWIFGSVALGRDQPGSDLDLFVLTGSEDTVEPILGTLADWLPTPAKQFGADVRPIVMSYKKVRTQLRGHNTFLVAALRDARVIMGEIPRELQVGKTYHNAKSR